jgi:hypothetical protein
MTGQGEELVIDLIENLLLDKGLEFISMRRGWF